MTHSSGTPAKSSGIIIAPPAKKNSDTKKAWKNRIRQACLSRVRRQSLSGVSSSSSKTRQDNFRDDDDDKKSNTYMDSRSLVEAELKLHGIRVVSPPSERKWNPPHYSQQEQSTMMMMDCGEATPLSSNDTNGLVLTEDEVIDLMEEIEREWKQHQERLLEEEMDRIENEEQALYDTIADYEQWADDDDDDAIVVLCPLCQEANLTTSHCSEMGDDIVCPNHMDGSCAFRLEARPGLSLGGLKERLAQALATHAEICYQHDIMFQVSHEVISDDDERLSLLWGTCAVCGTRSCVA